VLPGEAPGIRPRVSAVPRPRPARVPLRRPRTGALIAAAAYAAAAFTVYQLVAPALGREEAAPKEAAAAPALTGPAAIGAEELTLRALAGRAKGSAFVVEGAGGAHGSGFLAWVHPQDKASFFLTARAVVAGVLAGGSTQVYVKQGNQFWPARILREDENTGLAVLRVGTVFERPLWQLPGDRAKLTQNEPAVVVPAGSETAFGEGVVAANAGRFSLRTSSDQTYLGAPVVADDGRIAGVVVEISPDGESQVAPVGAACRQIRYC
jgi:hypothetical protein